MWFGGSGGLKLTQSTITGNTATDRRRGRALTVPTRRRNGQQAMAVHGTKAKCAGGAGRRQGQAGKGAVKSQSRVHGEGRARRTALGEVWRDRARSSPSNVGEDIGTDGGPRRRRAHVGPLAAGGVVGDGGRR